MVRSKKMKSLLALVLLAFAFLLLTMFSSKSPDLDDLNTKFPEVQGENLIGKSFRFPQDFRAQRILIVFAYKEDKAEVLRTWIDGQDLLNSEWEWYEIPVISKPLELGRWFIDSGMRKGIPDVRLQERVVTIYTDRQKFSRSLGIPIDTDGAYALVVERDGQIVGYISGAFTPDGASKINEWMKHD